MKVNSLLFLLVSSFSTLICKGQYEFSGLIDKEVWPGYVYLSVVEDYRKISGVYPEQIISKTTADSTGYFVFMGNNLPSENRMYRIHVDNCTETEQNTSHFNGHCPKSREIVFIANNTDTLSLPFSFDNEMFCRVLAKDEKANAFLKIDSLKNDMRFAFGTYRSEANRKINSKKWFSIFQQYGEQLQEPLAELYSYAFLSDRSNNLHDYYLEDLKDNPYYDGLLHRLSEAYPNSSYVTQYRAEITSDKFLVSNIASNKYPWWYILLFFVAFISIVLNFYLFRKLKKNHFQPEIALSSQEQKVLELILENKTNKEIASQLFLSLSTVKTHINNLYKKLNVNSRDEVKSHYPSS
jgi:DNA-binding CsgD family transcriptional regulator